MSNNTENIALDKTNFYLEYILEIHNLLVSITENLKY